LYQKKILNHIYIKNNKPVRKNDIIIESTKYTAKNIIQYFIFLSKSGVLFSSIKNKTKATTGI
jgi:hypothetical protein